MTQEAIESGSLGPSPAGAGDLELARICELGRLMALAPRDLISRITSDAATAELAAPRAHDPPGDDALRAVPTGAALASLAAIVSTLQRNPPPPLNPGHATWLPAPQPAFASPPRAAEIEPQHDDEPMPALSTWRQPPANDDDRWVGQQLRAAVLGLVAALALIAPALLWLGGWPGSPRTAGGGAPVPVVTVETPMQASAIEIAQPLSARPEPAIQQDTGSAVYPTASQAPEAPAVDATAPTASVEDVVQAAMQRIESGDVAAARDLLAGAGSDPRGLVSYALAETYDPNMLAAWGTRGIAPDVAKAKALYGEALELGNARARRRLDALQ